MLIAKQESLTQNFCLRHFAFDELGTEGPSAHKFTDFIAGLVTAGRTDSVSEQFEKSLSRLGNIPIFELLFPSIPL